MTHPYQPCVQPHLENAPLLVFAVQVELSSRQYHPDILQECLKSKPKSTVVLPCRKRRSQKCPLVEDDSRRVSTVFSLCEFYLEPTLGEKGHETVRENIPKKPLRGREWFAIPKMPETAGHPGSGGKIRKKKKTRFKNHTWNDFWDTDVSWCIMMLRPDVIARESLCSKAHPCQGAPSRWLQVPQFHRRWCGDLWSSSWTSMDLSNKEMGYGLVWKWWCFLKLYSPKRAIEIWETWW